MRVSRDQMLMMIAHIASIRGTCNRLSVGAVLAFEARPVSLGYNGAPSGKPHCDNSCNDHKPCTNTIHAEDNALKWARAFGIDPRGGTLYITDSPCRSCAEKIASAGVSRVVYDRAYRDLSPLNILDFNNIEVSQCHVEHALSVDFQSLQTTHIY